MLKWYRKSLRFVLCAVLAGVMMAAGCLPLSAQEEQRPLSFPSDWTIDRLLVNPDYVDDKGCLLPEKETEVFTRQAALEPYREQICALFSEDDYGSQYLDKYQNLHVMLTDPADAAALEGMPVTIHYVDYTYNELVAIQNTMFTKHGDALDLQSVSLRVEYNCLVASVGPGITRAQAEQYIRSCELNDQPVYFAFPGDGMYRPNDLEFWGAITEEEGRAILERQLERERECTSAMTDVRFAQQEEPARAATPSGWAYQQLYGSGVFTDTYSPRFTLGFFARETASPYRYGFVTAGHCILEGLYTYRDTTCEYSTGRCVGRFEAQLDENIDICTYDCAFVTYNKDHDGDSRYINLALSSSFANVQTYSLNHSFSVTSGWYYRMPGNGTSSYSVRSGNCNDIYFTFPNKPPMLCFTFGGGQGDSGAPVFYNLNNDPANNALVAMVVGGVNNSQNAVGYRLSEVCNQLAVTPINGSACKGDINDDGQISVADVRKAMRAVNGSETLTGQAYMRADMDCNGSLTQYDVDSLLRVSVGKDPWGTA